MPDPDELHSVASSMTPRAKPEPWDRKPWRFILPRWWKCWRNGHAMRRFKAGERRWLECYCGLHIDHARPWEATE